MSRNEPWRVKAGIVLDRLIRDGPTDVMLSAAGPIVTFAEATRLSPALEIGVVVVAPDGFSLGAAAELEGPAVSCFPRKVWAIARPCSKARIRGQQRVVQWRLEVLDVSGS